MFPATRSDKQNAHYRRFYVLPSGEKSLVVAASWRRYTRGVSSPTNTADLEHSADGPLGPEQLARIVDLSPDAIVLLDKDHVIRVWNQSAERIFGYPAAEAIGQSFDLLVPPDLLKSKELQRIKTATDAEGELRDYRTRRRTRDGREILVSLARRRLLDSTGEYSGTIAILRDISESVRLRQEAADTRHLASIGNIASQVAHEIRNPLAGIHGALQVLRRRFPPNSNEQNIFVGLTEEIRRLDGLVTDLQRFGRPIKARWQAFDLCQWMQQIANELTCNYSPAVELQMQLPDELKLQSDTTLLKEILAALFDNAVDYHGATDPPTSVQIVITHSGSHAQIDFYDNGPGISDDMVASLFEPFVTTKVRGSGLGLAICRRHVEALGGKVLWEPNRPNDSFQGAHFKIRLPLA